MAKARGAKQVADKMKRLGSGQAQSLISATLFAMGEQVQVEAQLSLTRGGQSGKGHVRSLPGRPPNQEFGTLGNNIETVLVSPYQVEVSSNADHALPLEFGTSKMHERPYMRPAVAATKDERGAELRTLAKRIANL